MTKIAYKVSKDDPNLPNGFVIDHFETENESEENYLVTSKDNFSLILANSSSLLLNFERNKGVILDSGKAPEVVAKIAEPLIQMPSVEVVKTNEEEELFKQFLAWKASQNSNS